MHCVEMLVQCEPKLSEERKYSGCTVKRKA